MKFKLSNQDCLQAEFALTSFLMAVKNIPGLTAYDLDVLNTAITDTAVTPARNFEKSLKEKYPFEVLQNMLSTEGDPFVRRFVGSEDTKTSIGKKKEQAKQHESLFYEQWNKLMVKEKIITVDIEELPSRSDFKGVQCDGQFISRLLKVFTILSKSTVKE